MRNKKKQPAPEVIAEDFAKRAPIGTPCRYFPIKGEKEHIDTTIRSEPWVLGHGAVVVKVDGRAGGVSIDHLFFPVVQDKGAAA